MRVSVEYVDDLVVRAQSDARAMTELLRLYTHFVDRVICKVSGVSRRSSLMPDIRQEALMGVARAVTTYDRAQGHFVTYVYYWIRLRVLKYLKESAVHREGTVVPGAVTVSLDALGRDEDGADRSWHEVLGGEEMAEDQVLVTELLANLPARDVTVLARRYVDDMTYEVISAELGMTREGVRQIELRTLARLRAACGGGR